LERGRRGLSGTTESGHPGVRNEPEAAGGFRLGGILDGLGDRALVHGFVCRLLPELGVGTNERERPRGPKRRCFDTAAAARDHVRMPLIETEEAARRLARAIASDLSLYNEDKIVGGIQNDNLFESLAEEIEEGRALYKRRVSPELFPRNFYDRALVDILVKAKGHIKSKLW
jgi:predicted NBD/HSP70 family sugar kinase